ncbi:unnamed protein product [Effrenium voratum]|nr:unnamed protein product [Effrenium voratum]
MGLPPAMAEAVAAQARAAAATPAGPMENAEELRARWAREAAGMAQAVRAHLEREGLEADEEVLADISQTLAEARSRGAPVPRAAVFAERAVARAAQRRARQRRMEREASGMDPEIEDAMAAAEQQARRPRRLGDS